MGELPQLGVMLGKAFLNPKVAPAVPEGSARPLGPGEYVQNPDGSWSNEITTTVQLPNGKYAVVPTLWVIDGKPTRVSEDDALALAQKSGLNWQSYDKEDAAESAAVSREDAWQNIPPEKSGTVPSLWTTPAPQNPIPPALNGLIQRSMQQPQQ